ncbi:helix-turn-helix domain-containing protein [Mesoflavibacter sp. CH_XMU1422-2]|uniref:helix-turn-helix domain-containing protein n=1 Tax=Mesoflavibacter sp. CH_XMU1422-2 TaxID=3107770 RepID=UPI0030085E32|nr:helix-turn-helix transcriptional regulator [Mesoflavibacter sp.]
MKNNLDIFKTLISEEKSGWLEKAKYRQENQDWLDISFSIAIKILSVLRTNKKKEIFPKNQKELAEVLDCSPQYVSKLLKGTEKLNIETISKIQKALNIKIIDLGLNKTKIEIVAQSESIFNKNQSSTRDYKKFDNVINCNFRTTKNHYQSNEYSNVVNG